MQLYPSVNNWGLYLPKINTVGLVTIGFLDLHKLCCTSADKGNQIVFAVHIQEGYLVTYAIKFT